MYTIRYNVVHNSHRLIFLFSKLLDSQGCEHFSSVECQTKCTLYPVQIRMLNDGSFVHRVLKNSFFLKICTPLYPMV